MARVSNAEVAAIYKISFEAAKKYRRNLNKVTFMSMTKENVHAFEVYGEKLEEYRLASIEAAATFAFVAQDFSTEELSAIITSVIVDAA